jgi:hypothetical protein
MSKNKMSVGFVIFVVVIGANFLSAKPATLRAPPFRNWTCHATIALTGSSYSYTPPAWQMSGPLIGTGSDREKRCREVVEQDWIDNGKIWQFLGIPASQQNAYCQSGGTFRADYGFDERPKSWNLLKTGKPNCKCAGPLAFQ